jgi:hypothetical protein
MDLTGAGTAIMLAIAAGLWFLYLVPTWFRRREYLATERTATRLGQTLRVLAETSEVPESVRMAATARDAARIERVMRARERRQDAMVARQVRAERAQTAISVGVSRRVAGGGAPQPAIVRMRMRRTRLLASALMVVSTVVGLIQIWLIAATGAAIGAWFVLGGALIAGSAAIAVQRRLDSRAMPERHAVAREVRRRIPAADFEGVPARPVAPAPWTPVAVPQPLYLSRPAPQRVQPAVSAERVMREAAAAAEQAAREAARPSAPVVPLRADPPAARATSRFAAMGIVDPTDTAAPDLDEVLRRRRSAG